MAGKNGKQQLMEQLELRTRALDWLALEPLTANALGTALSLSRNAASQYLNELVAEGRAVKVNTRPVYFFHRQALEEQGSGPLTEAAYPSVEALRGALSPCGGRRSAFDRLIGSQGSLSYCVKQCEAAISYPDNGLPILLQGPTGTGKSMIAQLMYEYGVERGILPADAPFITVNCSEYANNPELLLTNLFGYKKGAYTGADRDRQGLIALADGGVLFLDEVHDLRSECQEKLFLFMDKGIYHMVGDNENWYHSNLRLIFATTESPEGSLLKTFLRRIPLLTIIPPLSARPVTEKKELIYEIIHQESQRIGRDILVSNMAYFTLVDYPFAENVGQLVNAIKACVANAFLRTRDAGDSSGEGQIAIRMYDLPDYVLQSEAASVNLIKYDDKELISQQWLREGARTGSRLYQFNQDLLSLYADLSGKGNALDEFLPACFSKLERYTDYLFFDDSRPGGSQEKITSDLMGHICGILARKYGVTYSNNDMLCLSKFVGDYVQFASACVPLTQKYAAPLKECVGLLAERHRKDHTIATELASLLENILNVSVDELGFLDLFLFLRSFSKAGNLNRLRGIILAHGYSTASSMAEAVNQILGSEVFGAIDMPVESHTSAVTAKLTETLQNLQGVREMVLMVDMGSLENIGRGLEAIPNMDIGIVNNITTKLALDIGSMLLGGEPMTKVLAETSERNSGHQFSFVYNRRKEPAILSVCATGIGTAEKIANLFERSFPRKVGIHMIPYDFASLSTMGAACPVFEKYNVLFIAGSMDPRVQGYPFISVEEVVEQTNAICVGSLLGDYFEPDEIEVFNQNVVKYFSLQNLLNYLTILNPEKIINHVQDIIRLLQERLEITLCSSTVVGLYLHISCLIERLITDKYIASYENLEQFEREHAGFIKIVKEAFVPVEQSYSVEIPVSEIGYLHDYIYRDECFTVS